MPYIEIKTSFSSNNRPMSLFYTDYNSITLTTNNLKRHEKTSLYPGGGFLINF